MNTRVHRPSSESVPSPSWIPMAVPFSSLEEGGFGLGLFGDEGTALILSDWTFIYNLDCRTSVEFLMKYFHVYFCSFLYCIGDSIYLFCLVSLLSDCVLPSRNIFTCWSRAVGPPGAILHPLGQLTRSEQLVVIPERCCWRLVDRGQKCS